VSTAPGVGAIPPRPQLLATEDLPSPPRQQRSREKRAQLMSAGLALLGEKGYEAASVDEIAARAGVAVGGFYQHFRSKRQLLLVLMDELLERLSRLDLRPGGGKPADTKPATQPGGGGAASEAGRAAARTPSAAALDPRAILGALLERSFSTDLTYAGAYRAWREAILTDASLARHQREIERWTRARVGAVFAFMLQLPGARTDVDVPMLARLMDRFFWDLLGEALRFDAAERNRILATVTHLLYHTLFADAGNSTTS
jgi:AcrR family transcriptional regulator